jgi:Uma2 family endonuclease
MFTVYDDKKECFETVEEPDPSVSYTYADYLKWKFEERLELFRGKIMKLSAPNTKHQLIGGNLFFQLRTVLAKNKCQVFIAPFDVRLPARNRKKDHEITTVVQPDLCVICDKSKIDAKGCCGAPDLVIEILSPDNTSKEVKTKFNLYEDAGVKEYWIVYPEEESVAFFLLNDRGIYNGASIYAGYDDIRSTAVPGLRIDLSEIFTN